MHNLESVQKNETHKHFWDFDAQTDHLISARRPEPSIVKKNDREEEIRNIKQTKD